MSILTIEVIGEPQQQGSMTAFFDPRTRRTIVKSDNPKLKGWRTLVAIRARNACRGAAPVAKGKAVRLAAEFRLERPASVKREFPCVYPDLDKLVRAIGDALTGVVYTDDSQVCGWNAIKRYCGPGEKPGVTIRVALVASAQKHLLGE